MFFKFELRKNYGLVWSLLQSLLKTRCHSVKIKFYKRVPRKLVQKWKEGLLATSKKLILGSDQMVPNIWIFIFSYFPCKILEIEFPFHGSKWGFLKGYPQSYYRNKKRNPKRAQKSWSWILVRWFIKTLFWLRETVQNWKHHLNSWVLEIHVLSFTMELHYNNRM